MDTLPAPHIADDGAPLADRTEQIMGEIHTILAMRQSLAHIPGTHAKRAELLHECAELYDQLHDAR